MNNPGASPVKYSCWYSKGFIPVDPRSETAPITIHDVQIAGNESWTWMKRLLVCSLLITAGTVHAQVVLTAAQKNLPSVGQGVYIGIPRQQAVCLSGNGVLVNRWGPVTSPRMWRTTNAGDNWTEMTGTLPTSMAHDHLAVWNDTTYNFAGVAANRFDELIVNPDGSRNTVINQNVTNLSADQVIFSAQPANYGNDMVGLARNGTQGMFWYLSHNRGRTWIDKGRDGIFPNQSGIMGRMGITWNPPDTPIAVVYTSGAVNIYYYRPHDTTWVRHGTSQFNSTGLPDRFFSGIIVNGYTYVAGLVSGGYRVWRARAHTNDVPVETSLYSGAVPVNPYIALQEIKSMNAVMVYFLHGDGSLWGRLYYNDSWSTETLLSSVSYTNMVAPFQVPASHGNKGYLFGNTAAGAGYLTVVAITTLPAGVDDGESIGVPTGFTLSQNYPNPFNPATEIRFSLPNASNVRLEVFNVLGQRVATLIGQYMHSGQHTVQWDATREASGIYLYRLTAGDYVDTKKMVLLK